MSAIQNVSVIRDQLARSSEGVPLIGWFVYWSVTDFKDTVASLTQKVQAVGLNPDCVNAIREKSAFIRAVEEVAKAHKGRHKKISDTEERTAYIIYTTHVDPINVDATFTVETKATYTKLTDELKVEGPHEQEVRALYDDYKLHYYSDQFRECVLRLMKEHCQFITIRDRGGMYFIPATSEDGIKKIRKLFESYGECYLDTVGVANMAEAKKSMWRSLVGEVTEELQAMKEDLANLPVDPSENSLKVRLERYQALKDKVENYEIVLSGTAQDLRNDLSMIKNFLTDKLT